MQWSSEKYAGFTTVIPWEPTNTNYDQYNVATEREDPNSLLSMYRNLIQLRNEHAALRVGDFYGIRPDNFSILSYLRASKEETLLVMINLSEEVVSGFNLSLNEGPLSGGYYLLRVLGEGTLPDLNANSNGGFDSYQPGIEIPANGFVIIQLLGK
jgi:glycosidase